MTTIQAKKTGMIKRLMALALMVVLTAFSVACSDDEDTPTPKETIIGKWQLIGKGILDKEQELSECNKKSTVKFKSDGSFESIFYEEYQGCNSIIATGTWIDKGDNILESITNGEKAEGKYAFIDGNLKLISLNSNGSEEEYNIYKKI